jgi:hypothetical protein
VEADGLELLAELGDIVLRQIELDRERLELRRDQVATLLGSPRTTRECSDSSRSARDERVMLGPCLSHTSRPRPRGVYSNRRRQPPQPVDRAAL